MPLIGRFAPSPTGTLHLGNLRTALASWLSVKAAGGTWILRIEDVDRGRSRQDLIEEQRRDLALLGLESDVAVLYQSQRGSAYDQALAQLRKAGRLYPCRCTRRDLALLASAPHEADGLRPYPGTCRTRSPEGVPAEAWRFRLPEGIVRWEDRLLGSQCDDPQALTGDPLLFRRDGCHAYHLAVVVDDGEQGVTEVVRGADLRGVTATHIRLQEALGLFTPVYAHLGLVTGPDGARLGKRSGALGVAALQRKGVGLPELIGWLGWSLGCLDRPHPASAEALLPHFRWEKVPAGEVRIPAAWSET